MAAVRTKPELFIIESLTLDDEKAERQEGDIISSMDRYWRYGADHGRHDNRDSRDRAKQLIPSALNHDLLNSMASSRIFLNNFAVEFA